jgi:hypothetical protein
MKDSLRLPVEVISSSCSEVCDFLSTGTKGEIIAINDNCIESKNLEDCNTIPTPSGSMDSLSSNSHSSSNSSPPISFSFTTFGKNTNLSQESDMIGKKKSMIFIDDDRSLIQLDHDVNQKRGKSMEAIHDIVKVVIGSSDDDSGFENVKCEAN